MESERQPILEETPKGRRAAVSADRFAPAHPLEPGVVASICVPVTCITTYSMLVGHEPDPTGVSVPSRLVGCCPPDPGAGDVTVSDTVSVPQPNVPAYEPVYGPLPVCTSGMVSMNVKVKTPVGEKPFVSPGTVTELSGLP